MSATLEELEEEVELEGLSPGTPEFERALLTKRVLRCQDMQGVSDCQNCRAFHDCDWGHRYLIQLKYKGK